MTKAQRIEKYVKECFVEFSIDIEDFFWYYFEDTGFSEIPWINEDGKIKPDMVSYAAEILGISMNDILSANRAAIRNRLGEYPYLLYLKPFAYACEKAFYGDGFDNIRMFEVLFGEVPKSYYPPRYNFKNVKSRLIDQLKEFNKLLPGTYHEDATITKLKISTENFCQFEDIKEMTLSFISMIDKATELFLKAIHDGLAEEEVAEYNFLVSIFGIRDKYYCRGWLYYSQLVKVKDLYAAATKDNMYDFIIFRRILDFQPWRCSDFINDEELVKAYLAVVPEAKGNMNEYAMHVSHFSCYFVWSDAKPIMFEPYDEIEMAALYELAGQEPIPLEERAKEPTLVYVKKTAEELNGDDDTANRLIEYCRPDSLGGLQVKFSFFSPEKSIGHIKYLFGKIESNNYMDRLAAKKDASGGCGNE